MHTTNLQPLTKGFKISGYILQSTWHAMFLRMTPRPCGIFATHFYNNNFALLLKLYSTYWKLNFLMLSMIHTSTSPIMYNGQKSGIENDGEKKKKIKRSLPCLLES